MRPLLPLLLLAAPLAAQVPIDSVNQDRANLVFMVQTIRHEIEPAVAAMPATKFGFAPPKASSPTSAPSRARPSTCPPRTTSSLPPHWEWTHPPTPGMRWGPTAWLRRSRLSPICEGRSIFSNALPARTAISGSRYAPRRSRPSRGDRSPAWRSSLNPPSTRSIIMDR